MIKGSNNRGGVNLKRSRLDYSIMNSGISTLIYVLRLVIQFVARSFFIRYLGEVYLGLNGLFTNILSLLSVAELGIGTSIIFALYKPLAVQDHEQVKSLMRLYKRAYEAIGLAIAAVGLAIMPFLKLIVNKDQHFENLYLIFLLFLANSVVSYFFTYKRSLITADQKAYIVSLNDFLFLVVTNVFQIVFLILTSNFIVYLIIQIISTIASNITISIIADRRYPYIKEKDVQKLDAGSVKEIKRNVIGNVSSKIGGQIVMGTDNILISAFVNLSAVGLYSNYTLIVNAIQNVCTQITNSITASIGNYAAERDAQSSYVLFKRHFFINHTLVFFTTTMLLTMINPFITWWVGGKYNLTFLTVVLIVANYAIQVYRNTGFAFIESFGLFWYQRTKAFIEAAINLSVSLILLGWFKLGINGVLLGTIVSSFGFVIWYEAYVVFKHAFHRNLAEFAKMLLTNMIQLAVATTIVYSVTNYALSLTNLTGIVGLALRAVIALLVTVVLYAVLYWRNDGTKYLLSIVKRILKVGA